MATIVAKTGQPTPYLERLRACNESIDIDELLLPVKQQRAINLLIELINKRILKGGVKFDPAKSETIKFGKSTPDGSNTYRVEFTLDITEAMNEVIKRTRLNIDFANPSDESAKFGNNLQGYVENPFRVNETSSTSNPFESTIVKRDGKYFLTIVFNGLPEDNYKLTIIKENLTFALV